MRKTVQIQIASLLVGAALLGGVAMPTWAVDGVILIDQNKAMAGNVTLGDTPGFPVTISLPGSYRLSGNLTVPDANTTAIEVTAGGVSIDLNGFGIFGPTNCTGFPVVTSCAPRSLSDLAVFREKRGVFGHQNTLPKNLNALHAVLERRIS